MVQLNSFHLKSHTRVSSTDSKLRTQKVQPHLLTQGLTLGVKGLTTPMYTGYTLTAEKIDCNYRPDIYVLRKPGWAD